MPLTAIGRGMSWRCQTHTPASDPALIPRETEVLSWLVKGKTKHDIADILGISPRTAVAREPATVVNPFAHPRTLVSDFAVAEQLLKYQLCRVLRP